MRIATISSKKLADIAEGSLKNNYLMQGAFAEMDPADGGVGWNDFELRNYDPQIGRWVQQDPYQQFASPYVGMGNDPVNSIDPSGGDILPVAFKIGGEMSKTAATAITLGGVVIVAGRPVMYAASGISVLSKASIVVHSVTIAINIINNSITSTQAGNQDKTLLIAQSNENELVKHPEDGMHSTEGGGIAPDNVLKYATEGDLKKMMLDLIEETTSSNKQMREVALKMTNRFFDNTGGEFSDSRLNEAVQDDENFQGFSKNVFSRLNEELKNAKGDITKISVIKVSNPAFNRTKNIYDGLGITIHGVSYVEVHLLKFQFDPKTGNYHADLKFDLYDNFGLDKEDIKFSLNPFSYHNDPRLRAWFILQHKYNHVPLRNHVTVSFGAYLNINSTYGIRK